MRDLVIPIIAEDPAAEPSDVGRPVYNNRRPHNWAV
jgi:hypothetical protein